MDENLNMLIDKVGNDLVPLTAVALSLLTGVIIVLTIGWVSMRNTRERERSRREVAAYVAEGSMMSEDAERLLNPSPWFSREASKFAANAGCKAKRAWKEAEAAMHA